MMPIEPVPVKTREIQNQLMDSTIWNDFPFRNGDVVIATYAKAGTTWTQQIVGQLLFGPNPDLKVMELSPWLETRRPPREVKLAAVEAQDHRRFLKTHLPADALVISPLARYVYIGRDGRDVLWSLYNHHVNFTEAWYQRQNDTIRSLPGLTPMKPPTGDIRQYWREWLDGDGYPWWSWWENVRSWWALRHLPNVLLVHFARLKQDMPGEMRRIADFLEIPIREEDWPQTVEYCTFDWMKQNADRILPEAVNVWEGGARTFIHKGVNGRWRDVLTAEEIVEYEARALEELGPECAHWLATGESR